MPWWAIASVAAGGYLVGSLGAILWYFFQRRGRPF
jgi:hypothetical protein